MAEIKLTTDADKTIDQLRDDIETYKKTLAFQIFRALGIIENQLKIEIKKRLKRRTGRLMNTWGENKSIKEVGNEIVGELSSAGVPYAAIHEFGGVITAKDKKLTFPTESNMRPDGSPKITLKEVFDSKRAFVTPGGALMMEQSKGNATAMFIFKDSVTIPARPYIKPALAATRETILKNFGLFIAETFKPKKGS